MNIAICDDETVFIRQLHRKISEMKIPDCHVYEFTSGRDLLNNTVEGKFEIIILDVEMPEMNGLSVAEIIRRTDKNVTCNVNREQTLIEVNLTDADEENADFTHFFAEFPLSSVFANFDMFNKISENLRSDL